MGIFRWQCKNMMFFCFSRVSLDDYDDWNVLMMEFHMGFSWLSW
jgi:hypothetical protein